MSLGHTHTHRLTLTLGVYGVETQPVLMNLSHNARRVRSPALAERTGSAESLRSGIAMLRVFLWLESCQRRSRALLNTVDRFQSRHSTQRKPHSDNSETADIG